MSSRRARRALRTAEEAQEAAIAEELAALPDEEEEEVAPPKPAENHLRRRPRVVEEENDSSALVKQEANNTEPSPKRLRVEEQHSNAAAEGPGQGMPAPASEPESGDQVASALKRLTSHISNPAKFSKAAPLLRQLLESGKLTQEHRVRVFEALRAAFPINAATAPHLVDPHLRREVMKLATIAESHAGEGYFSRAEKAVILDVWHHLAITRNEMQTDDSFVFSKVLAKVRGLVDALPDVEDEVEAGEAYEYVLTGGTGSRAPPQAIKQGPPAAAGATAQQGQAGGAGTGTKGSNASTQHLSGPSSQQGQEAQEGSGAAAAAAADEDDDPFGLGEMLGSKSGPASGPGPATSARQQQQQQQAGGGGISKDDDDDPFGLDAMISKPQAPVAPAPAQQPVKKVEQGAASTAWGASELQAAQRRVALDCVQHARTFHKNTWAQTGIEMLAEHCWQNKRKFSPPQHPELDELWVWVRKARATRKLGPSAKELNRDSTSFERARAEWSKATVSHRGKVGAQGDAKSANWLG